MRISDTASSVIMGAASGVIITLIVLTMLGLYIPRNDTDAVDHRSGLRVYTDAKTGCQYLTASGKGLVLRHGVDCNVGEN